MKPLLVTAALPYANGPIHVGHLVEYIQADIWVRYWRARGRDVVFVCADDTHGTPIMLRARQEGISIDALLASAWREHSDDFAAFGVDFDCYYTTHSEENRELATEVFAALQRGGHIVERDIEQPYCEKDRLYLPDRYIIGQCPHCGAEQQYGDSCEVCSQTCSASALKNPVCAICGAVPVFRTSRHLFFRIADFAVHLRSWMADAVRPAVIQHKLTEWFDSGLADWDISRDEPYFGFEIPGYPGKYFYVWLDAPIGYMATTLKYCRESSRDFDAYWRNTESTDVVHFIGKDIAYFHGLFWPAMLAGAGFRSPSRLFVHGFLTINGKKMSKRRGTFITASDYRAILDPELLRYYFASKLAGGVEDLDFGTADFVQRVNTDVVNKIVNLYSRSAALLRRNPQCVSDVQVENHPLAGCGELQRRVSDAYEALDYARVVRMLTAFADDVNVFFQTAEPWRSMDPGSNGAAICLATLGAFRSIMTMLSPIMPRLASSAAAAIGLPSLDWSALDAPTEGVDVQNEVRLFDRIDPDVAASVVPVIED